MTLTIIPADAPREVRQLIWLIYGPTGAGKTTLAMSAERPLLLDFEDGENRAIGRCDMVEVGRWEDVENIPADQMRAYATLVPDTVGALLEHLFVYLLKGDRKLGTRNGAPTIQGWMALGAAYRLWLARVASLGLDVVLLAHEKEEQQGEDVKIRPDIVGQSRQLVYAKSHIMGLLCMDPENRRVLDCNPSFRHHGKNPPQWPPMVVPDWTHEAPGTTLADLMADAKAKMSRKGGRAASAGAPEDGAVQGAPGGIAGDAATRDTLLAGFNRELTQLIAKGADKPEKYELWKRAESLGFVYDEQVESFVHPGTSE